MKKGLLFLFVFVMMASAGFAQGNYTMSWFRMTINGSSNLHDWHSNVGQMKASGVMTADAQGVKEIKSLNIEIPVKSIKSEKGSIMDGKTYDALKANSNPQIYFKLERVNSINNGDVNATGTITIAGNSKQVDMNVKAKVQSDGSIMISGSKKLKMTDFKISPPTALMGTLTTGDDIELSFQVQFYKS